MHDSNIGTVLDSKACALDFASTLPLNESPEDNEAFNQDRLNQDFLGRRSWSATMFLELNNDLQITSFNVKFLTYSGVRAVLAV